MPKCKIFDLSDFHDFYTIKSLWGRLCGFKKMYIWGFIWGRKTPYTSQSNFKKNLVRASNFLCETFETICWCQRYFFCCFRYSTSKIITNIDFLTRMLRPIWVRWANESGTDAHTYTEQHTSKELMRALSIHLRNWCVHWAYTSGTKLNDA